MAQISDPLERKFLVQDLLNEAESDEEGGARERVDSVSEAGDHGTDDGEENEDDEDKQHEKAKAAHEKQVASEAASDPSRGWVGLLSNHRKKHNTGPKGVKADYEEAKRIVQRLNETKALQRREALRRAGGTVTSGPSISYSSTKLLQGFQESELSLEDVKENDAELQKLLTAIKDQRLEEYNSVASL